MFLKQKIRKAFKNATPNLLDRVMQEHPRQDVSIQSSNRPLPVKATRATTAQWVAAAAAIVVIIGAIGSGLSFVLNSNLPSGSPGGIATTPPTEAPWVDITKDERYENLIAAAKNSINPSDRDNIEPTEEYFSTTWQGNPAWVVSVTYKGYWYQLTFTEEALQKLEVIPTDSLKEDTYITSAAAIRIAYLQVDDILQGTNYAWFCGGLVLDQNESGTVCYYVTLYRKDPAYDFSGYEYKTFCIHAYTGEVLGVEEFHSAQYTDMTSRFQIENQLWSLILENLDDLPGYERTELTTSTFRIKNSDLFYKFILTYDGHEYTFETDRTGKVLSIDIGSTANCPPGNAIAKGVALKIVSLARGEDFADGQTVTVRQKSGHYYIVVSNAEQAFYMVNAFSGDIVEDYDLALLDIRDIALGYHGLALEDCLTLSMELENEGTQAQCVRVSAIVGSGLYAAAVDTSSGKILDSYVLMVEMPSWMNLGSIQPWRQARDNGLEYFGVELDHMTRLQISLNMTTRLYTVSFATDGEEYACYVSKNNCQVIPADAIPVEDALAIMIPNLPEEVQMAHGNHATLFGFSVDQSGEQPIYELTVLYKEIDYCAKVNAITGQLLEYYTKEAE